MVVLPSADSSEDRALRKLAGSVLSAWPALMEPAYSVVDVPLIVCLPTMCALLATVSSSVWLVKLSLCRLWNNWLKLAPAAPFSADKGIFTHGLLESCPVSAGALK